MMQNPSRCRIHPLPFRSLHTIELKSFVKRIGFVKTWRGKTQKSGYDSVARMRPALRKKRELYDLAVVCYPSLSIDLLYDFKKVQPMPKPIKYHKKENSSSPFSLFPCLVPYRICFRQIMRETRKRRKLTAFTEKNIVCFSLSHYSFIF